MACERELLEETGVTARVNALLAMQFTDEQWCAVFRMDYVSGMPRSDGYENSEILLLDPAEAITRPDITNMSRAILTQYLESGRALDTSAYVAPSKDKDHYVLFQNHAFDHNFTKGSES